MARFATLVKGLDQLREVDLQLPGPAGNRQIVRLGVKPLPAWEEVSILAAAGKFATERGAKAVDTDHVYVMGVWVHTLLAACVSVDAEDAGVAFFGSVEEILQGLDRDRISYLYEEQQIVQEQAGARIERMSAQQMVQATLKLAEAEGIDEVHRFLSGWGPTVRATLVHYLAVQLFALLPGNSPSGQGSSGSTEKKPQSDRAGDGQ